MVEIAKIVVYYMVVQNEESFPFWGTRVIYEKKH